MSESWDWPAHVGASGVRAVATTQSSTFDLAKILEKDGEIKIGRQMIEIGSWRLSQSGKNQQGFLMFLDVLVEKKFVVLIFGSASIFRCSLFLSRLFSAWEDVADPPVID